MGTILPFFSATKQCDVIAFPLGVRSLLPAIGSNSQLLKPRKRSKRFREMALRVQSRHPYSPDTLTQTQTLSAKNAAALDKELMSTGAFSIDQLMELAGLSVSQAGMRKHYP